jgi:hypothetical protein
MKSKTAASWILGAVLVLVLFGAVESVRRVLQKQEPMIGGLNVTSDDLVGMAESNAYSDKSDSKTYGDISWKIKQCSTITQADLNRAVNNAIVNARLNCRRGDSV